MRHNAGHSSTYVGPNLISSANLVGFFHWVDLSTLSLVLNFQIAKIGKAKNK